MGENGVGKNNYQGSAAAAAMEVSSAEHGQAGGSKCYDDDGRLKGTGQKEGKEALGS
uniref:Uncharacterized protein n=1 Tax=Aegilops tauschii TaxID=37682 RepID=M8B5G8_AEGTA